MYSNTKPVRNIFVWLIVSAILVVLDQYTKHLAVLHLKGGNPFVLISGVFEFYYSENQGAAFGMLQGKQFFFFLIAIIVLAVAAFVMIRMPSGRRFLPLAVCTELITAGAIGNMIDRQLQGYVVDFLYFKLINFPIFNVADIYVTCAAALLIILLCFYYQEEELNVFHIGKKNSKGETN